MIKGIILDNGNLKIELSENYKSLENKEKIKKFLLKKCDKIGIDATLKYLIRKLKGFKQINAYEINALTDSVLIIKSSDKRNNPTCLWYSNNYMILNEVLELCNNENFIFTKIIENKRNIKKC